MTVILGMGPMDFRNLHGGVRPSLSSAEREPFYLQGLPLYVSFTLVYMRGRTIDSLDSWWSGLVLGPKVSLYPIGLYPSRT